MKRLVPLLLLAGCSGTPGHEQPIPPYAILTSIRVDDPRNEPLREFAAFRRANVIRFDDLDKEQVDLLIALRTVDPMFVCFVVPPEQLTVAFTKSAFDLVSKIDRDPFVDAYYGFLRARDAATLRATLDMIKAQTEKVEKRLLRLTEVAPGSAPVTTERLEWASGLPRKVVGAGLEMKRLRPILQDADYLVIEAPFPVDDELRLDSIVAFSAVPTLDWNPLFKQGLYAFIGSVGEDPPSVAGAEMEHAILVDEPIGEAVKFSYDLDTLRGRVGSRVLIGDPMIHPFRRDVKPPLAEVGRHERADAKEGTIDVLKYQVTDVAARRTFIDPFFGAAPQDRLYVRVALKGDEAIVLRAVCESGGKEVPSRLAAQRVELWRGRHYLHVVVVGDAGTLAVRGLVLTIESARR